MFKRYKLLIFLFITFTLSGCASMFGDNTRQVVVYSDPAGANIYMDGKNYGTTPTVVILPSYIYGGKAITLKKDGYLSQELQINTQFQMVGLWNILNFPLGFIIDAADGNIIKIDPNDTKVTAKLQSQQSSPSGL